LQQWRQQAIPAIRADITELLAKETTRLGHEWDAPTQRALTSAKAAVGSSACTRKARAINNRKKGLAGTRITDTIVPGLGMQSSKTIQANPRDDLERV
jgi:hypothetical protein